ncbi:hypothetical protein LPJ61_005198 [Coemansia biformis]|uniref:Pyrroline-5-carboxylate reductase n=1 Tax=Coemansia biformis TaxID=1286918 RepID=A0A9W7Y992_9FUNG|nr:hypothetical protein LPJ61_005198 [Coemansia biformis]
MVAAPCITFIGGGNMCEAILAGLIKTGHPVSHVRVSEPGAERREFLKSKYGVDTVEDNNAAITGEDDGDIVVSRGVTTDVVVLAVKPQVVAQVVRGVAASLCEVKPLVVSIVAGVAIKDLARWIGGPVPLVRLMPNTPALVGEGAAGMYADATVTETQRAHTEYIVTNIAKEFAWVPKEEDIDTVTAISGSGPAYFFLVIEAIEKAGAALGLDADAAKRLAAQTALGAAKMVLTSEDDVATLRRKVTSPNGTTQAAIEKMIELLVPEGVDAGVRAAKARCVSLSDEFCML